MDTEITSAQVIFPDKLTLDEVRESLEEKIGSLEEKIEELEAEIEALEATE